MGPDDADARSPRAGHDLILQRSPGRARLGKSGRDDDECVNARSDAVLDDRQHRVARHGNDAQIDAWRQVANGPIAAASGNLIGMLQISLRTLGGTSASQGVGRPTSN